MPTATASSPTDLRASQRYPTHFDGIGILRGTPYPIVIADISRGGAMVRGLPPLPPGAQLTVQARSLDVAATVVRSTARGLGLRFQTPVDPLDIVRQNYAGLEHLRKPVGEPGRASASPATPR
jgi:hypothetical protein